MPTQRPPDVPPGLDPQVAQYLRRLATWAYQEIDAKVPKEEAVRHILLSPITQKPPTTIFEIVVNETGSMAAQRVALGGGKP